MPNSRRVFCVVLCLVASLTLAAPLLAQSETTNATFSGPVQLSGVLLPAGAYSFAVARDRLSVVVSDAHQRVVAMVMVSPITRTKAGDVITMRPSVGGAAP